MPSWDYAPAKPIRWEYLRTRTGTSGLSWAEYEALLDAVEAAEQVRTQLLWGDTRTSDAYVALGTALNRFDFGDAA